ncbi:MAG: hypothetical protein ACD_75C01172G0001, partial [uncultured bacterium]
MQPGQTKGNDQLSGRPGKEGQAAAPGGGN